MTSCSDSHLNSGDLTLASIPTHHVFLYLGAIMQVLLGSFCLGDYESVKWCYKQR